MIRRAVLEWGEVPYGADREDPKTIPPDAADRIATVAAASPLSGRGGTGVLEHGRKALRARGVVGVIAAEGCSLEILPKIDVVHAAPEDQNAAVRRRLVHMLAVALDTRIDVGMMTELDWQRETLLEILIKVFSKKLIEAVRRGMPRRYVGREDDLPALRGSLNIVRQFTIHAANPSRLACRFDALSEDIAINRIMKAAIIRLGRITQSLANQRRLRELAFIYTDIAETPIAALRWDQATIDRANERWRDLLGLARLLLGDRFQTTTGGDSRGFSLLFEMSALFEEYVGRLLSRALAGSDRYVVRQGGRLYCLTDQEAERGLFQTKPDILIKHKGKVVQIVDTKWKRIAPRLDDKKQGISQGDVYQMMAYGQVYRCPKLTLLYPHHAGLGEREGVHATYPITGSDARRLSVATFDISRDKNRGRRIGRLLA